MLPRYQVNSASSSPVQPWLFQVQPYSEESFGHFLGRFRRANHLSSAHLSAMLKQRPYVVSYWETPSRRRQPDASALQHLSQLTGVTVECLKSMRSPPGTKLHLLTRLCSCCYSEPPHHRWSWQVAERSHCEIHQHRLLEVCPDCRSTLQLPSYWQTGTCDSPTGRLGQRCHLPFQEMSVAQKPQKS